MRFTIEPYVVSYGERYIRKTYPASGRERLALSRAANQFTDDEVYRYTGSQPVTKKTLENAMHRALNGSALAKSIPGYKAWSGMRITFKEEE